MKKKEGFAGQQAIVLPHKVLQQCRRHPLIRNLYITDIGYYPKAAFHYRERKHGSEQHILIYCTDGKGEAVINGIPYHIQPSEFLILPAGLPHAYWAHEQSPWSIYWLHFNGNTGGLLGRMLYERLQEGDHYIKFNEELIGLFRSIYRQLEKGYSTDNLVFSSLCLHYFLSSFIYPEKFSLLKRHEKQRESISDKAIHYLKNNIHQALSLREISAAVNLSASHFSSVFRQETGFSPIEYFNHLKMQKACQLLQFTRLRISEVAMAVGVEDAYYFSRLFHSLMGVSPRGYRNRKEIKPQSDHATA